MISHVGPPLLLLLTLRDARHDHESSWIPLSDDGRQDDRTAGRQGWGVVSFVLILISADIIIVWGDTGWGVVRQVTVRYGVRRIQG